MNVLSGVSMDDGMKKKIKSLNAEDLMYVKNSILRHLDAWSHEDLKEMHERLNWIEECLKWS
jgi:hypothetical protein